MKDIFGLTDEEVLKNRKNFGANVFTKHKKTTFFKLFVRAFADPIIKILLVALIISVFFLFSGGELFETLGILFSILVATLVSAISESASEKAFEKLTKENEKQEVKVIRNGKRIHIPVFEVVTGDVVILNAGDKIPADGVLIDGELYVNQASLNGESKEAAKTPHITGYKLKNVNEDNKPDLHSRHQVFMGTTVTSGYGLMTVINVGATTIYGNLAEGLKEQPPNSPLKQRLTALAKTLSGIGYFCAVLVALAYLFNAFVIDVGFDFSKSLALASDFKFLIKTFFYAITLAVSVIVVAVPEGLPMMITVVLSANMKKMLKDGVLIKRLSAIETSGSLNILFFDKTGTITKGKLSASLFIDENLNESKTPNNELFKQSLYLNNESLNLTANSTDACLFEPVKNCSYKNKILRNIKFNSTDKFSAVICENLLSGYKTLIKGAPEKLIHNLQPAAHSSGENFKKRLETIIKEKAEQGMRVIMLTASRDEITDVSKLKMDFIGIACIKDEIRDESRQTIIELNKAGIQTVMITGDNLDTAAAIAEEVGLIDKTVNNKLQITNSAELNKLTDDEVKKLLPGLRVVARALPSDKTRLVRLSQELNLVAGMTGDGINDAPALKKADVGFSMGSGTEVAKEASNIVLTNDNLISAKTAVLYGRTIFKSIRKFLVFQLTINFAAVLISIVSPFLGIDTPITILQMLWINMIIDTLAGIAFSGEPPLPEYLLESPKKRDEKIITKPMWRQIIFSCLFIAVISLIFLTFNPIKNLFNKFDGNLSLYSAFFTFFVFSGVFMAFNARTTRINLLAYLNKNKAFAITMFLVIVIQIILVFYFGKLFRAVPLSLTEFLTIFTLSALIIPFDFIRKIVSKKLFGSSRKVSLVYGNISSKLVKRMAESK